MRYPNLFVAGAPKCGTSSLYRWLSEHPEICPSSVKETFFLVDRDHPYWDPGRNYHDHGLEGYERYFRHCGEDIRYRLDGTTHYLYQETALDVLGSLQPAPTILVLLRRPSERIYSAFRYSKYTVGTVAPGSEDLTFGGFVDILRGRSQRELSGCFPEHHRFLGRELEYSKYVHYLERWSDRLGPENLHVHAMEEMSRDSRAFMLRLSSTLDLDADFYRSYGFERRNRTVTYRHPLLRRAVRMLSPYVPGTLKELAKNHLVGRITAPPPPRTAEDERVMGELDRYFEPYNEELSTLLGLDVTAWAPPVRADG